MRIIPMADFFNHGYPPNVEWTFDESGNCIVVMTQDVEAGAPLHISYGQPTNPSRFLATFGFLNEAPATYCKLLIPNPSREMRDIGYDPERMLFSTVDGGIAEEVWDVVLFSRLERQAALASDKQAFYQAVMSGDDATKQRIHSKYYDTTSKALKRHVEGVMAEIFDLKVKMNAYDSSRHPRLPLLMKHNDMVYKTFDKVRTYLSQ